MPEADLLVKDAVIVKRDHPNSILHGHIGEIIEVRNNEFKVQFRIAIQNKIESMWISRQYLKRWQD